MVLVRCPAGDLAGKLLGNEQFGVSNTGRLAWQLDQVFLNCWPDKRPARQLAPDRPGSRYWIHPCAYSMLAWPGGAWGIKKHCFFIGFSRFWSGGAARQTKKNNSFGDGLREPKPSFSFVFSMFPRPGGPWGIKKHCFFIGFSRFGRGGERGR